jgi:hypothetical protein
MKKMGLLLLACLPVSPLAFPQSTPATTLVSGPNTALPPAQVITLGIRWFRWSRDGSLSRAIRRGERESGVGAAGI